MEDDLKWKTTSNGRQPRMKDNIQWKTTYNERQPTIEDDLKLIKLEYLSNHSMDCGLWIIRGILEENSEEISSVALLSPACLFKT